MKAMKAAKAAAPPKAMKAMKAVAKKVKKRAMKKTNKKPDSEWYYVNCTGVKEILIEHVGAQPKVWKLD